MMEGMQKCDRTHYSGALGFMIFFDTLVCLMSLRKQMFCDIAFMDL